MTAPNATALRIAADMREQRDREAAERLRGLMARDMPCERCVFVPTPDGKCMCRGGAS